MTTDEQLERRYRRRLWAYPAPYRAERGDEIVGVLLDCSAPARTRPSLSDTIDLTRGGVQARLRHRGPAARAPWTDALSILTVLLPILLAAPLLDEVVTQIWVRRAVAGGTFDPNDPTLQWMLRGWIAPAAWVAVAMLVFARKPRLSLLVSGAAVAAGVVHLVVSPYPLDSPLTASILTQLVGLVAVALLASRSRIERGITLVGRRGAILAVAAAAALQIGSMALNYSYGWFGSVVLDVEAGSGVLSLVTIVTLAAVLARRTSREAAHRVWFTGLVVTAIMFGTVVLGAVTAPRPTNPARVVAALIAAVLVPIVCLAVGRRMRPGLRGRADPVSAT